MQCGTFRENARRFPRTADGQTAARPPYPCPARWRSGGDRGAQVSEDDRTRGEDAEEVAVPADDLTAGLADAASARADEDPPGM
jgi:hypothetical protein